MRIVEIRELTVPIASAIANAYIDFSKMTCSLVAVVTDVVRDGRTVIGYGFNSNGRYAQAGLLAERFIPRLLGAAPSALLDDTGNNFDPARGWEALMADEKPGGHGERSVDYQMRRAPQQRAVLMAGRLALTAVDDHRRPFAA